MTAKLTRRQWAAAAAALTASLPPNAHAQSARSANPAELLAETRKERQSTVDALRRFKIPMSLEPAFQFKA